MNPTGWHEVWAVVWGATWGNNMAWLESLLLIAVFTYFFKDYIGRVLAKWWHKHHKEHAIQNSLEAMRRFEAEKKQTVAAQQVHDIELHKREREAE